jgi:ABC-type multidrug transport system ATPase subunit
MNDIISVNHLSKNFGSISAVDDLSFSVNEGEVYGFLGQNGAGKSTTIRMLLTLVRPSAGSIHIFKKELHRNRKEILRHVGAIIEKPDLYQYLTALENLDMMSRLNGKRFSREHLLKQLSDVGLADRASSKVKTFSQGMKQRLGIACALVHDPALIILDEPTNGLDPQGISEVRKLILHLSKEEGKTILVSSHLLAEIEMIADSMLIIDSGKKVAEGRVADLLHPASTLVEVTTLDDVAAKQILSSSSWVKFLQPGEQLLFKMHREEIPRLARFCIEKNISLVALRPKHSLEDYFLSLTTESRHVATHPD